MAGFNPSSMQRTWTCEIEVSNLDEDTANKLDTQLRLVINQLEIVGSLLQQRPCGEAALVVTDEKRRTEHVDLEMF